MAVHDDGGDITGYLGIHRDVSEREWAEARLEEARELERSRIARALHDDALQALADAMVLATGAREASPSGLTVSSYRSYNGLGSTVARRHRTT